MNECKNVLLMQKRTYTKFSIFEKVFHTNFYTKIFG